VRARRILTQDPEGEPLWVCLYVHQLGASRSLQSPPPRESGTTRSLNR